MATDPVCLAIVDGDDAKFTSTHRSRNIISAANWCKKKFEENPKRYTRISTDMCVNVGSCT